MKASLFYKTLLLVILVAVLGMEVTAQNRDLEFYIEQAKVHNPSINEQQNQMSEAGLQVDLAKAELTRPYIYGTADFLYAPVFGKFGYDKAVTNGGLYSALLNIEYPLLSGSKLDTRKKLAGVTGKQSAEQIKLLEHELRRQITGQYLLTYQDAARLRYLAEVLDLVNQQKEVLEKLGADGIAKITDISQIGIEIARLKAEQKNAESSYRENLYTLNSLSGVSDTSLVDLPKPELKVEPLISNSEFLQQFRIDSLQQAVQQQVSELKYKPSLTAFGNSGLNTIALSGLDQYYGFSAGLNFTIPIYDGHQKTINRQQTKLNHHSVKGYEQQFIVERQNNLNSLNYRLTKIKEQQALLNDQMQAYEDLLKVYKKELSLSELSIIDFITFLRNYTDAQNQQVQVEVARLNLINEFNYWNW